MSQQLTDAQYQLELCQTRAQRAENELLGMTARYNESARKVLEMHSRLAEARGIIVAQDVALKIYRQDIDLWDWIDTTAAREHSSRAEAFADWYAKTGLIGIRNQRDSLQGSFVKAK